jgi:hypothetical protein
MEKAGDNLDGFRDESPPTEDANLGVAEIGRNIDIDEMLQTWTGEFGRWQLKHFALASLAWTLVGLHTMVIIFAAISLVGTATKRSSRRFSFHAERVRIL